MLLLCMYVPKQQFTLHRKRKKGSTNSDHKVENVNLCPKLKLKANIYILYSRVCLYWKQILQLRARSPIQQSTTRIYFFNTDSYKKNSQTTYLSLQIFSIKKEKVDFFPSISVVRLMSLGFAKRYLILFQITLFHAFLRTNQ